jgi:hypothetical protein
MTKQERDKLRTLALAATPGEWEMASDLPAYAIYTENGWRVVQTPNQNNRKQWGTSNDTHGIGRFSDAAYIAAANPATLLALLDRIDELDGELAASKVDAERYKRELQQKELVHVGYTNPYQIKYAKDEEGSFYPDTDNECYIPLYMLKKHKHRLGPDAAIDKARGR